MWHYHGGHVKVKLKTVFFMVSGAAQWKLNQTTHH
jgi:hypothetical protein